MNKCQRVCVMQIKFLLLSLCFVACSGKTDKQNNRDIARVKVAEVTTQSSPRAVRYIGVIEEKTTASLSFMTSGTLSMLSLREGQKVKKGQLIAKLNAPSINQAVIAARAKYEQAQDAFRRMDQVYKAGSLSDVKYVQIKTELQQAKAMYEMAENELQDTYLYAPFSGVVGQTFLSVGESVLPGVPVLTLLHTQDAMAKVSVPAQDILNIQIGDTADLAVNVLPNHPFEGTVAWSGIVSNALSHTYEVMIQIANTDGALLPGMLCDVTLYLDAEKSQIVVPNNAVTLDEHNRKFVWLVQDGKAVRQPVQVGELTDMGVSILDGLQQGDVYVIDGKQRLSVGLAVEIL